MPRILSTKKHLANLNYGEYFGYMISRWFHLQEKALQLRLNGASIPAIENQLKIPRSTLSGWFKGIVLPSKYKKEIRKNWLRALAEGRKKAVLWHNREKEKRMQKAQADAMETLKNIDLKNKYILELALSLLYLGEGSKKADATILGSSDPLILKFFISMLKNIYHVDAGKIRCQLNLRADQNPEAMKRFWSKELRIPLQQFDYIAFDKRTIGSKTYPHYKGVCRVRCGHVNIQRKLIYLSTLFCEQVSKKLLST